MENIMSDKFLYWPLWLNQPILSYQYMPVCVYVFVISQNNFVWRKVPLLRFSCTEVTFMHNFPAQNYMRPALKPNLWPELNNITFILK